MSSIDVRQTQLFVDDDVIEHQTLLERVVHQPVRSRLNPLLTPDTPWEAPSISFVAGVYRDESSGRFRAWYVTHPQSFEGYRSMLCVADSDDGVRWERPELDLYRELVNGPSNILHASPGLWDGPTVLHDPDDLERPWRLVFHQDWNLFVAHSPDGLSWTVPTRPEDALARGFGDRTTALLDPTAKEPYVVLTRDTADMWHKQLVRSIYRIGSRDGRTVSTPSELALRPDLEDGPHVEFYQMSGFRYESLYLGFVERYHTVEPPSADIELTVSRDGRAWDRVRPRSAFFAPPPGGRDLGAFDYAACTPTNSPPILHDGALWIYYYGSPGFHGDRFMPHKRSMGLAHLAPDGFVSLRAGRREGYLTTRPFSWPGGILQMNHRLLGGNLWRYTDLNASDGWVRLELLDADGNVIPGYSRDESDPLYRDAIAGEPTWSGKPQDLDAMIGKTVRLRFCLRSAELYSFRSTATS